MKAIFFCQSYAITFILQAKHHVDGRFFAWQIKNRL
jgi:hypothetical protein